MPALSSTLLIINTGSSSVKFQLFKHHQNDWRLLAKGMIQEIGLTPEFIGTNHVQSTEETLVLPITINHEEAIRSILTWVEQQHFADSITAIAHRVVHGGSFFQKSVRVTPEIITSLKNLCPFAPLHQGHNIKGIEICHEIKPNVPQVACFDTAFHASHTPLFINYALPESIRSLGIRRYGFHGLSYEWIMHHLRTNHDPLAKQRIVAAHLGNGASLCAIDNGISIDTTMGLTALDGLPMGTRCGSLDPGVVIYLARDVGLSIDNIENILYTESGLKGLSDYSSNVRLLQTSNNPKARYALDYFCLKTAQMISMMVISLGGIDGLIFTGGIGENAPLIRNKIIAHLNCLKPFEVRVIPANEEKIMAMQALALIADS